MLADQLADRLLGEAGDRLAVRARQQQAADPEFLRREQRRPARRREATDALDHLPRLAVGAAVSLAPALDTGDAGDELVDRSQRAPHRLQLLPVLADERLRFLQLGHLDQGGDGAGDRGDVDDQLRRLLAEGRGDGAEVGGVLLVAGAGADQHHHPPGVEADPEAVGAAAGDRRVGAAAEQLGRQRGAGVPVRLDGLALGADLERDQGGGAADGDDVAAGEAGLVLHHHQPSPELLAEGDRGDDVPVQDAGAGDRADHEGAVAVILGQRLADVGEAGDGRFQQPRHRVLGRPVGQRHRLPLPVGEEDGAGLAQQFGQAGDQVLQRATFEHEVAELLVDGGGPAQRPQLPRGDVELGMQLEPVAGLGHGDRGEVGEGAGQLRLLLAEVVLAIDVVQHHQPDDLPVEDHRHLHDRADLPVADGRFDHARVLAGVGDDHRLARLQHLPGDAVGRDPGDPALDVVGHRGTVATADAATEQVLPLLAHVDAAALHPDQLAHLLCGEVQEIVDAGHLGDRRSDLGEGRKRAPHVTVGHLASFL